MDTMHIKTQTNIYSVLWPFLTPARAMDNLYVFWFYFFLVLVVAVTVVSYCCFPLNTRPNVKVQQVRQDPRMELRHWIYFMAILLGGFLILSASMLQVQEFLLFSDLGATQAYHHFGFVFGGLFVVTHSVMLISRCRHPCQPLAQPVHAGICSVGICFVSVFLIAVVIHTARNAPTQRMFIGSVVAAIVTMLLVLLYRLGALCHYGRKNFEKSLYTLNACPVCR
jgi:hypothetical protein